VIYKAASCKSDTLLLFFLIKCLKV